MNKLHRWEYDKSLRQHYCADPELGAVDSGQRCCPGCGAVITDKTLRESKLPVDDHSMLSLTLTYLGFWL